MLTVSWIERLKSAFFTICNQQDGTLNFHRWSDSNISAILFNVDTPTEETISTFTQIDTNSDGLITYDELLDYAILLQNNVQSSMTDKHLDLKYIAPNPVPIRPKPNARAPEIVKKAIIVHPLDSILTAIEKTMFFYSVSDCRLKNKLSFPHSIIDFCYVRSSAYLAVALSNRTVSFYDIRASTIIPFSIKSTFSMEEIRSLGLEEVRETLRKAKTVRPHLFNGVTAMESSDDSFVLFVGDQEGMLEVIAVEKSRLSRTDYVSKRLLIKKIHKKQISQISFLDSISSYASSCLDGSVLIWKFSESGNVLSIMQRFDQPEGLPINSFVFDRRTFDLFYRTPTRVFGRWRVFSNAHQTVPVLNETITAMGVVQLSEDASVLIVTGTLNNAVAYEIPYMKKCGVWELKQRSPGVIVSYKQDVFACGIGVSKYVLDSRYLHDKKPHPTAVIGIAVDESSVMAMSCDDRGYMNLWDLKTGRKKMVFTNKSEAVATTFCADLKNEKFAIGYSDSHVIITKCKEGTVMAELESFYLPGAAVEGKYVSIENRQMLAFITTQRFISIFEEISSGRLRFKRNLIGHNEQICTLLQKNHRLVSVGTEKEMLSWSVNSENPVLKYESPLEVTCLADLPTNDSAFLAGAKDGHVFLFNIDQSVPVNQFIPIPVDQRGTITTLACLDNEYILSGNSHGFVSRWSMKNESCSWIIRASTSSVIGMYLVKSISKFLVLDREDEIMLFDSDTGSYVGRLGRSFAWEIEDKSKWDDESYAVDLPQTPPPVSSISLEFTDDSASSDEYVPVTQPPVTYSGIDSLMEDLESVYNSGNEVIQSARDTLNTNKRSALAQPARFEQLIVNDELDRLSMTLYKLSKKS